MPQVLRQTHAHMYVTALAMCMEVRLKQELSKETNIWNIKEISIE